MFPKLFLLLVTLHISPKTIFCRNAHILILVEKRFAIDPRTNQALYPDTKDRQNMVNRRCFGRVEGVKEHPFIVPGIHGTSAFTLGAKLLAGHRKLLLGNLANSPDCKVHWIWRNLDLTVPYRENRS